MPDMSGYEVARAVRAAPWGRSLRLVAVTGWGTPDDKRRAHQASFDAHLSKPVDVDALAQHCRQDRQPPQQTQGRDGEQCGARERQAREPTDCGERIRCANRPMRHCPRP